MEKKRTYSPLGANYEGATDDLAVFANSAKGLCGMLVGDPEAVEELGALLDLGCLSKGTEVLDGHAVFVWGVSEHNDVDWLVILRGRSCGLGGGWVL